MSSTSDLKLLILQASNTPDLVKEQIEPHPKRFWTLMACIDGQDRMSEAWLNDVEAEDSLFPLIQPADWAQVEIKN